MNVREPLTGTTSFTWIVVVPVPLVSVTLAFSCKTPRRPMSRRPWQLALTLAVRTTRVPETSMVAVPNFGLLTCCVPLTVPIATMRPPSTLNCVTSAVIEPLTVTSVPSTEIMVVFQSWTAVAAKIPEEVIPKRESVLAMRDFFEERGRIFQTPCVGDLVIFITSPTQRHIGFVEMLLPDGKFASIESNFNDGVMRVIHSPGEANISDMAALSITRLKGSLTKWLPRPRSKTPCEGQ